MALTRFPHGVSSFGIPVFGGSVPSTFGDVYFVDYRNGSDGNSGKSTDNAVKTLSKAYALCTSNNNDVILIDGDSGIVETAMISWSKNRIHVYGLDGTSRKYGQGARVSIGVTTDTADVALLQVTGVRNSFHNIKFSSSNTLTEGKFTVQDGGEYTVFECCEFYLSSQLAVTDASEFLCNGDSSQYRDCTFGSNVAIVTANGERPCVSVVRETVTGKVARDVSFIGCNFWRNSADVDNSFIYSSGATDVERLMLFEDCLFCNTLKSSTVMTLGIVADAALTEGQIILKNCASYNVTDFATQTGIWQASGAAQAANGCEVIQSA
jgi:hypothetical protein